HKVESIKDIRSTSVRLLERRQHRTHHNCTCTESSNDRTAGCKNLHKCTTTARKILDNLLPKFNPNTSPKKDDLTLTHQRLEKNAQAMRQQQGEILFNPSVTEKNNLSECFHIFVDPEREIQLPAYRLKIPAMRRLMNNNKVVIYTDESCTNNGKENARCGGGIWVEENHPLNRAIRIPGPDQSNQVGKIAAVLVALQTISLTTPITIITDSHYIINGMTSVRYRADSGSRGVGAWLQLLRCALS
ncbi:uncharacterized protein EDB91DRAFT_1064017, partial [Suillus paluster]|uniref:uncharacterized protein n=1 Tax=Suillus paluster TaxID=48578 RepID=UPI001B875D20